MQYVIDMDFEDDNGTSKRQQLMQVLESTPENSVTHQTALERLSEAPELPFYLEHIWNWFWELNSRRTSNGFSQNPISWADFGFWNYLKQRQATPLEIEILETMDRLYLKYTAKKAKKDSKHGNIPAKKPKKR